jgi:outer membrane murein-binding lipoprotein Lpp
MRSTGSTPPPADRAPAPVTDADDAGGDAPATPPGEASTDAPIASDGVDLSSLSIAGITKRRVGVLSGALVAAWIVIVFARQAGDTATAAARVDQMTGDNRALAAEVASLEQELQTIERPAYVAQAARAFRMGSPREVPFTLDKSVPPPGANAPGSAALRLGARERTVTPLESWLSILFGPSS